MMSSNMLMTHQAILRQPHPFTTKTVCMIATGLVLLCFSLTYSRGQEPVGQPAVIWEKMYYDYGGFYEAHSLEDGNIVVLATVPNGPPSDFRFLKIDQAGNILWNRSFGGENDDMGNSLTRTSDGGFLICGFSRGLPHLGQPNTDIYLIKTDNEGNLEWEKTYGGPGEEWGWFACQREGGGYLIFGGAPTNEDDDLYVAITDPSGNIEKQRYFRGGDSLKDVSYESRRNFGNGHPTLDGGCVVYTRTDLLKLGPGGDLQWGLDFGTFGDLPRIMDVDQTSDSGYAVAIQDLNTDKDELQKLNANGNLQWITNLSDDGSYAPVAVQELSNGTIAVGGSDGKIIDGKRTVVTTDALGNIAWSLFIPGHDHTVHAELRSVVEGTNNIIVAGRQYQWRGPHSYYTAGYIAKLAVAPRASVEFSLHNYE